MNQCVNRNGRRRVDNAEDEVQGDCGMCVTSCVNWVAMAACRCIAPPSRAVARSSLASSTAMSASSKRSTTARNSTTTNLALPSGCEDRSDETEDETYNDSITSPSTASMAGREQGDMGRQIVPTCYLAM